MKGSEMIAAGRRGYDAAKKVNNAGPRQRRKYPS